MEITLQRAAELLLQRDDFAILIHRHPDGDAVFSALALYRILMAKGKRARICCADEVPSYLSPLCPVALCTDGAFGENETLVSVDVAEPALLGALSEPALEKGVLLKIDHHRTGLDFAEHSLVDAEASAAGEIIYRLAKHLAVTDEETLLACYGAIASDTGGFRYANSTAGAFAAAVEMRGRGISFEEYNAVLFESKDYKTLAATAYGVAHATFHFDGRAALFAITREEMAENGFTDEHLSEIGGTLREIRGVDMAMVLREIPRGGRFRLSTRSTKGGDCIALCAPFGGGGHLRAAGATIDRETKAEAVEAVLEELKKQFEKE